MLTDIDAHITSLQSHGTLPPGPYEYTHWERIFSFIFRVSIRGQVFFFKKLKPRMDPEKDMSETLLREHRALTKLGPFFSEQKYFNIPRAVYFSEEELLLVMEELEGKGFPKK